MRTAHCAHTSQNCITSPLSHHYLTSISPVSHHYLASFSPVSRQYLASISPVSHQYLASISPLFPSWAGKFYYCKDFCNKSHPFRLPVRIRIRMVSGCRRGGRIWALKWARVQLSQEIVSFVRISIINRIRSGTRTGSGSEWFLQYFTSISAVRRTAAHCSALQCTVAHCAYCPKLHYLTIISPLSYHYLTNISSLSRQYPTVISPIFHQYFTSISPVSHQ